MEMEEKSRKFISDIINSEETSELSKLIPLTNIKAYLNIYCLIESIDLHNIENIHPFIGDIEDRIYELANEGWIEKEDSIEIVDMIYDRLQGKKKWSVSLSSQKHMILNVSKHKVKHSGSYKKNNALDFLIYAIVYDLKHFTKKPHYYLVADFIGTITLDNSYSEDNIRVCFNRLYFPDIVKNLSCYNEILNDRITKIQNGISQGFFLEYAKFHDDGLGYHVKSI